MRRAKRDPKKITPAMQRTLEEWLRRRDPRQFYSLFDVFPEHSNRVTAYRKNCERLIEAGVLVADDETLRVWQRKYRPAEEYWPPLLPAEEDTPEGTQPDDDVPF